LVGFSGSEIQWGERSLNKSNACTLKLKGAFT